MTKSTLSAFRKWAADDEAWLAAGDDTPGVLAAHGIEVPADIDVILLARAGEEAEASAAELETAEADVGSEGRLLPIVTYGGRQPKCPHGWRPVWRSDRRRRCTKLVQFTKCLVRLPSGECGAYQTMLVCLQHAWVDEGYWYCAAPGTLAVKRPRNP